jgi:hypothetical protein
MQVEIKEDEDARPVTNADGSTTRRIPFSLHLADATVEDDNELKITASAKSIFIYSARTDAYYYINYTDIVNQVIDYESALPTKESSDENHN